METSMHRVKRIRVKQLRKFDRTETGTYWTMELVIESDDERLEVVLYADDPDAFVIEQSAIMKTVEAA